MNTRDIMIAGQITTSVLAMATFIAGVVLAYAHHGQQEIELYTGAIIANATNTIGFWIGSSMGSQRKDEIAANGAAKPQ